VRPQDAPLSAAMLLRRVITCSPFTALRYFMSNSTKIGRLSEAFRDTREALGIDLKAMAQELGVPYQTIELIEACDWSDIPSDKAYELAVSVARRLGLDLDNYYVDRAFFFGDLEEKDTRHDDLRRERIVMTAMVIATIAMLAWLLIPADDISQPAVKENSINMPQNTAWQRPASDQPYPVLGEVAPEIPITEDGALISLRATDSCNAIIVTERGQEQTQVLRMSEPWKLRIKGAFELRLDNAGVVAVEVAGQKIQHGAGVGQYWSGVFDARGVWQRPRQIKAPMPEPRSEQGEDEPELSGE